MSNSRENEVDAFDAESKLIENFVHSEEMAEVIDVVPKRIERSLSCLISGIKGIGQPAL